MTGKPFRLAVRAVIFDDQNRCLLLRRSQLCRGFAGTWEWPGGKSDPGETFDVAVLRETAEETGLTITLTGVAGAFAIEMAEQHLAVLCLEAKLVGGDLDLSEEHDDYVWAPLSDVLKWDLTDGFRDFARDYLERVCKGD